MDQHIIPTPVVNEEDSSQYVVCSSVGDVYAILQYHNNEIEKDEDTIRLLLKSKPGSEFDKAEINKCLEYTKNRITSER